ncbi:uncharacterized protein VTP21DRAFT_7842 [Calcarisporiella thermophila]|uniref:uncharacterized protein n=1 Tax=Calcarisporiella thermophila TaxID=911321 RepID=UPI0037437D34
MTRLVVVVSLFLLFTPSYAPSLQQPFRRGSSNFKAPWNTLLEEVEWEPNVEMLVKTSSGNTKPASFTCEVCLPLASKIQKLVQLNFTREAILYTSSEICARLGIQSKHVCKGIVPEFGPWGLTVLGNTFFKPINMCRKLRMCPLPSPSDAWEIPLPPPPPAPNRTDTIPPGGDEEEDAITLVQLTDWHYDPEYQEGLEGDCRDPICCRPPNGKGVKKPAGRWGEYKCDVPKALVENIIKMIPKLVPSIDFAIMTGDMPPHDIWAETISTLRSTSSAASSDFLRTFGETPLYLTIGNHEGVPTNSFPTHRTPEAPSASWLYHHLSSLWKHWFANQIPPSTFVTAGFYSASLTPTLRLVSLNTNFFYNLNWWMLMRPDDEPDPEGMLSWLVSELWNAEREGKKVIVIGHMSPLDLDAFPEMARAFSRIVARFNDTIVSQFYGHSHYDEFHVFYDPQSDDLQPVNVAYVAPSVTPYKDLNPAFRVYKLSKKTYRILNHYTYSFDLDAANKNPEEEPNWSLLYDAKSTYDLEDLSAHSWHELTERLISADKLQMDPLLDRYTRLATRNSAVRFPKKCEKNLIKCARKVVCRARSIFGGNQCKKKHARALDADKRWGGSLKIVVPEHLVTNEGNATLQADVVELERHQDASGIQVRMTSEENGMTVLGLAAQVLRMLRRYLNIGDDEEESICV